MPELTARYEIISLLAGRAVPFGPAGQLSAIHKTPVNGKICAETNGLVCDQQGDTEKHGGPEKALHHYPLDHYASWLAEYPEFATILEKPGAFGENFSTRGICEEDVCIGDIYRAGTALIQVSQARQPCWKLNVRFSEPKMARRVQESRRTGWYYRVLEAGEIEAGDTLELLQRPHPDWPLSRLLHCFYVDTLNYEALREIAALDVLAESWRKIAVNRLEQRAVEPWERRLTRPASKSE